MINIKFLSILFITFFFISCTDNISEKQKLENKLIVHELSDPDKLNPLCSQGAGATYIEHNIFMYLLDVDKENLEIIPWLAEKRPTITEITEGEFSGGLKIDYVIKKDAVWDNGTPVTAHDVVFAFKCVLNTHVDAEHQKMYIDFIKDIKINSNPKKFSFFSYKKNYAAEFFSGGTIHIIPEYVYDEKQLMRNYTLKQLANKEEYEKIRDDKTLRTFAKDFNSEYFQREKVEGCGAYTLESWVTGERIKLKKKDKWWGEKYQPALSFENYPKEIVYEIISDQVTAVTALKDAQIDIMRNMKPSEYARLLENKDFNTKYNLYNVKSLSYDYIGINTHNEILNDKKIRKALTHIVDVAKLNEVINYGYASPISSFVHPSRKFYNKNLKPYEYNLEKAVEYIEKAGYTNFDDDGVRYKIVDGENKRLDFTIKFNSGNDRRETISLFMKKNAKKIGIKIEPLAREWTVYLDECTNHDFDLFILGWVQEAIIDDPKQLFHTEAYNGGSNYSGFGDEFSDQLIEDLRKELDEEKRFEILRELQAIVYEEVPYIFLYTADNLMAISKKFDKPKAYIARPGYDEREMNNLSFTNDTLQ